MVFKKRPAKSLLAYFCIFTLIFSFIPKTTLAGAVVGINVGQNAMGTENIFYGNITGSGDGSLMLLQNQGSDEVKVGYDGSVNLYNNILTTTGSVRSANYCDQNGNNCFISSTAAAGSDGYIGTAGSHTSGGALNMSGNNVTGISNLISASNRTFPYLVLDSVGSGDNWTSQGAHISIGESGDLGSASMHMTYRGDGYGFIGSGAVSNGEPGASYLRFDYNSNNIYTPDALAVGSLSTSGDVNVPNGSAIRSSSDWMIGSNGTTVSVGSQSTARNIGLYSQGNATPAFYANTSGNVGVGTASPDSKVEVYGSGSTQLKVTGGSAVETVVLSENSYGWLGTQTNHPLYIGTNYGGKMYIATNGDVGIGNDSPTEKLTIGSGNIELSIEYGIGSFVSGQKYVLNPRRTGVQAMTGGAGAPYDDSMTLESDAQITFLETDTNKVSGWMNVNGDEFYWAGSVGINGMSVTSNYGLRVGDASYGAAYLDGDVEINGLLDVFDDLWVSSGGELKIFSGDLDVDDGDLTVANGELYVDGWNEYSLNVRDAPYGSAYFEGDVDLNSDVNVGGTVTVDESVVINANETVGLTIDGAWDYNLVVEDAPYGAAYFNGYTEINGDLDVYGNVSKSGGSFTIDHPLDPANRILQHSFVESPEMRNVYYGQAETVDGYVRIALPEWWSALNGIDKSEYTYQMTSIGKWCNMYVAEEIENNQFAVATNDGDCKFSWTVSAIRHDAYAEDNRIEVEKDKEERNKGECLYEGACE